MLDASAVVRSLRPGDSAAVAWLTAVEEGVVEASVPDLVFVETASALLGYLRHGEISATEGDDAMQSLLDLPLDVCPLSLLSRQALALAQLRRVSVYDACYLALAIGYDAVLVTADRRLAAEAEKVALLPRDHPPAS